jgi:uncharacterized protein (DUF1330 family)
MTVFMIVHAEITGREAFKAYAAQALPLMESFGGRRVAVSEPVYLEGAAVGSRAAVYEWDSREAAEAFWSSPDYARVRSLRENAGTLLVTLIG